jgi:endonuclease III
MKTADIPFVHRVLGAAYRKNKAPIIELIKAHTDDPFKILVATILSARTRDQTTARVVRRLFGVISRAEDFDHITQEDLEKLLLPIGFFRTKAKHLKLLPAALRSLYGGAIPQTIDELCRLPGVGRKTANLVVSVAFDKPAICVDVHVHRISNRLGLLATKAPYDTEMELRRILPVRYWQDWNRFLVSFGQTVCLPVNPRCAACPIATRCERVHVRAPDAAQGD